VKNRTAAGAHLAGVDSAVGFTAAARWTRRLVLRGPRGGLAVWFPLTRVDSAIGFPQRSEGWAIRNSFLKNEMRRRNPPRAGRAKFLKIQKDLEAKGRLAFMSASEDGETTPAESHSECAVCY
jgi:hypothetical protein